MLASVSPLQHTHVLVSVSGNYSTLLICITIGKTRKKKALLFKKPSEEVSSTKSNGSGRWKWKGVREKKADSKEPFDIYEVQKVLDFITAQNTAPKYVLTLHEKYTGHTGLICLYTVRIILI